MLSTLLLALCCLLIGLAKASKTHVFNFTTGWVTANPDGMFEKQMIGFNGEWPIPDIHVNKGDRVLVYLTNGFEDLPTSLHFHGLFQNTSYGNSNAMDGPQMVTQCPIMPGDTFLYNFTVPDQVGTYWYHSHSGAQYTDGMRAAFIVHDEDEPFEYDQEMIIMVSDLYHKPYTQVTNEFLSRYNPTGAEPIPQNMLFNNTVNASIAFESNKTYLLRLLNTGNFLSQYLYIEDHEMTIVEVDGVYVKPNVTDLVYMSVGQRMSVLVRSKDTAERNYAFMQKADDTMLDSIPSDLVLNRTNQVIYDEEKDNANEYHTHDLDKATNDFYLVPLVGRELYDDYDYQITFDVKMDNLGDGVNYAFFNNISYVAPKVPTLVTALTAGKLATEPWVYGDNINAHVLQYGEVVELVVNNYDDGRHPFHLHGHNFQIVQKSQAFDNDNGDDVADNTVPYNESSPLMPFPDVPMIRDTIVLEPNGHIVLRFKADNPGVWIFHCHVDWHLEQGLAAVFIEAPLELQDAETLSENYLQVCASGKIPTKGNAAGHFDDWYDMSGLPRQPAPLPEGFTIRGYIAFLISTLIGLYGLYNIVQYGINEVSQDDSQIYERLKHVLEENGESVE